MIPTREDFTRWREDPVTRFVLKAHRQMAEDCKDKWAKISWDNGVANQASLDELRYRADTYEAISEAGYESYCDALGEAPRED